MTVYRGWWSRDDRVESFYRYLPFDLPPGAPALSVRLDYDRNTAALDLGVFDPQRFRGWSGADRDGFVIAVDDATPGYLPGELPAGQWRVIVGLHRVPANGVDFALEVSTEPAHPEPLSAAGPRPERRPARPLPATDGRRWLAGDLHSHSVHSDGVNTVVNLACHARSRHLDFLAITDHNTVSHHPELSAAAAYSGVLLLAGQEVTTDEGHANCLGDTGWIDFRDSADGWLTAAESRGGLLSINHPLAGDDCGWRRAMQRRPPLAEVWHGSWDRRRLEVLAWWESWGAGLPVGGSDFHDVGHHGLLGAPTTWLEVEDDDLLGALRAGRIAISANATSPVMVRNDGELVVLDAEGACVHGPEGSRTAVTAGRQRLTADVGPYLLVAPDGRTLALVP